MVADCLFYEHSAPETGAFLSMSLSSAVLTAWSTTGLPVSLEYESRMPLVYCDFSNGKQLQCRPCVIEEDCRRCSCETRQQAEVECARINKCTALLDKSNVNSEVFKTRDNNCAMSCDGKELRDLLLNKNHIKPARHPVPVIQPTRYIEMPNTMASVITSPSEKCYTTLRSPYSSFSPPLRGQHMYSYPSYSERMCDFNHRRVANTHSAITKSKHDVHSYLCDCGPFINEPPNGVYRKLSTLPKSPIYSRSLSSSVESSSSGISLPKRFSPVTNFNSTLTCNTYTSPPHTNHISSEKLLNKIDHKQSNINESKFLISSMDDNYLKEQKNEISSSVKNQVTPATSKMPLEFVSMDSNSTRPSLSPRWRENNGVNAPHVRSPTNFLLYTESANNNSRVDEDHNIKNSSHSFTHDRPHPLKSSPVSSGMERNTSPRILENKKIVPTSPALSTSSGSHVDSTSAVSPDIMQFRKPHHLRVSELRDSPPENTHIKSPVSEISSNAEEDLSSSKRGSVSRSYLSSPPPLLPLFHGVNTPLSSPKAMDMPVLIPIPQQCKSPQLSKNQEDDFLYDEKRELLEIEKSSHSRKLSEESTCQCDKCLRFETKLNDTPDLQRESDCENKIKEENIKSEPKFENQEYPNEDKMENLRTLKPRPWSPWQENDAIIVSQVTLLLKCLLGEERLQSIGYPDCPVHTVVLRVIQICQGRESSAPHYLCSSECFRGHVTQLLRLCSPMGSDVFGWNGRTIDEIVDTIYTEELKPLIKKRVLEATSKRSSTPQGGVIKPDIPTFSSLSLPTLLEITGASTTTTRQDSSQTSTNQTSGVEQPIVLRRKRGRPAKYKKTDIPTRPERVLLWKFLIELLEDIRNASCLRWVYRDEGIFRILNTEMLAKHWGRRHGNSKMTYEKMARAMRTYYRTRVLLPVPRSKNLPRKLVYKFNPTILQRLGLQEKK